MDNSVSNDLSLFLKNDTLPAMQPITPMLAMTGIGRGNIPNVTCFMTIDTIKTSKKKAAHFPAFVFDQIRIFIFLPPNSISLLLDNTKYSLYIFKVAITIS